MTDAIRGLRAALGLLTVLPLGRRASTRSQRVWAVAFFPVVGALIGGILYLAMLVPVPELLRAALVLAAWVAVTGGLHEDGWADTMDAAFAHVGREERIRILKDPRAGAHAVTGTLLILLVRFSALAVVPAAAVAVAPVIGRGVMAVSLSQAPPLEETGLGARWSQGARPWPALLVTGGLIWGLARILPGAAAPETMVLGVPLQGLPGPDPAVRSWLALTVGALAAWAFYRSLKKRFGGLSGDGHGAVGLLAETAALCAFVPLGPQGLLQGTGLLG